MATTVVEPTLEQFEVETAQAGALVLKEFGAIIKIENDDQFQKIARAAMDAAANIKAIQEHVGPEKKNRYDLWKKLCEVETRLCQPFEQVKTRGAKLTAAYQIEQEQKRQREEAELQRKAQEEAEKVRQQQAEQLDREGRMADAVALLDSDIETIIPVVAPTQVPKVTGISAPRTTYKVRVTNLMELVKAVAEGKAQIQFLILDESFANKMASALKGALSIPGLEVVKDISSSVRSR